MTMPSARKISPNDASSDAPLIIHSLSEREVDAIREEMSHYEQPQAAAIEALKIVQAHRGWVSDTSLREIAKLLQMSADELEGVATFYSMIFRRPVGKNVLMLCTSISCWLRGCEKIKKHISQRLNIDYGETTADERFTLLPVTCQGACDRAPVLLKNQRLHTHLHVEQIDAVIEDA